MRRNDFEFLDPQTGEWTVEDSSESGDSLIEVLLALLVLGIASLSILIALATSLSASVTYRQSSRVDTVLRTAASQATQQIEAQSTALWASCGGPSQVVFTLPSGFTAQISSALSWNGSSFGAACVANSSQLIDVMVTYKGVHYDISTVIYDPNNRPLPAVGAPTHLAVLQQPGDTGVGASIDPAPVVAVEDASGNIVTSDLSLVLLGITPGTGAGGASISNNCSGSSYYGVVTFSNCSINFVGSNYTFTASDGALATTTTNPFNIYDLNATRLVIVSSPVTGVVATSPTLGAITVQEQNILGNAVSAGPSGVALSLFSSSGGGVFATTSGGAPTSSVSIPAGASSATFFYGDLQIGSPTITVSSPGMFAATQIESLLPAPASQLVISSSAFTTTLSTPASASQPFTVSLEDSFGNLTARFTSTILNLSSTSLGAKFSTSLGGSATTSVVLPALATSVQLFYGDTQAGSPTISISASGLSVGSQVESVTKTNQLPLSITSTSGTYNGSTYSVALTTSGGSGTGVTAFVALNGTATGCAITGSTLSATTTGTCLVTATNPGDANYNWINSLQTTVIFVKANQAALVITPTTASFNGATYRATLLSSGGSGSGTVSFVALNGTATGCTLTGTTLTATTAGTCLITATNSGDTNYNSTSSPQTAFVFTKATQNALTVTSTSANYNGAGYSLILTFAGGSGTGTVSFSTSNGTATGCNVTGTTLTATSSGTCLVTATNTGDANYLTSSSPSTTVTFSKVNQSALTVTSIAATYNGSAFTLLMTSSGGTGSGAVTYVAVNGTATGCTITGSTLTANSSGTCLVTATKAADVGYLAVSSVATSVTFAKALQSPLTLTSTVGTYNGSIYSLPLTTAGGSGNGVVTYAAIDGSSAGCTIVGSTVTATTTGTCLVTATNPGDVNYLPVSSLQTMVTFVKANQLALTVSPTFSTYNGSAFSLNLTISGGSGSGGVSLAVQNGTASGCTLTGSTLTSATAGTCLVTATNPGDSNYNPISSPQTTVTFAKANQSPLTLTSTSATFDGTSFNLALTSAGGTGSGTVSYVTVNGSANGCSVAGSTLTATSSGSCLVTVTNSGDSFYLPVSSSQTTVTFSKANQATLIVGELDNRFNHRTYTIDLTTSGGTGTGTVSYAITGGAGGCSLSGSVLSLSGAGSCQIVATNPGDGNYNSISSAAVTFVMNVQAPLFVTSTTSTYNGTAYALALTTSGGSGTGAVTYVVANGTATGCAISGGSTLIATSSGTCTVTATMAGDANYPASMSSAPTAITFSKAVEAVLNVTSTSGSYNGTTYSLALTSSGGSGTGGVTYVAVNSTATGCSVSGSILTASTIGTCTVTATKATDVNYLAVSSAPTSVTFSKSNQAALVVTSTTSTYNGSAYNLALATSGGSGTGVVTYVAVNGTASGCTIAGSSLTATSSGTCLLTGSNPGDANYNPISSTATTVTFAKATQSSLTVTSLSAAYNGTAYSLALTTSGGSGTGALSYVAVNGTAFGCTATGSILNATTTGTCIVTATKATDVNYLVVSSAPAAATFTKATQGPLVLTSTSSSYNGSSYNLVLTTSGGSGTGALSYVVAPGTALNCAVTGNTLTVTTFGTCIVIATQAADVNFLAVASAPTTVTFSMATQAALTVSSSSSSWTAGTYTLTLVSSGGSGTGNVTFAVANGTATGCSVSGPTLTATSAGTCLVTATNPGDTNYLPVSSAATAISTNLQTPLSITSTLGSYNGSTYTLALSTSGGSGTGGVTYIAVNGTATGCSVSGATLSSTTFGTCVVTATNPGDANYLSVSSVPTTVTFAKAVQSALALTFTTSTFNGSIYTLALTTTGGSGTGVVSYVVVNGTATGCTMTGTTLTSAIAGTCIVTATNPGDANYLPVSSVPTSVAFSQAAQAALVVNELTSSFSGTTYTIGLSTSGGSGSGVISYAVVRGTATTCSVTGSTLTATGSGTCLVTATKAADVGYLVVSSAQTTFTTNVQLPMSITSVAATYNGSIYTLALVTSGGSGSGAVTYVAVIGTATGCTVTGSTLTATSSGTCLVTATRAASSGYLAISSPQTTVTFFKAAQNALAITSTSATFNGSVYTLALSTSGGSGTGAVTYVVTNGTATGCTVTGSTLTSATFGTCLLTATKATDVGYNVGSSPQTAVNFAKANQGALLVTSTSATSNGTSYSLNLTSTGGTGTGTVSYVAANGTATGCSVTGSTLTATSSGTCLVTANNTGDANYNSVSSAPTTVTFSKATQSALTLTSIANSYDGTAYSLALTTAGGSGTGGVTYIAVNGTATGCTVAGSTLTATSSGTCLVTATNVGDAFYNPVSSASSAVNFSKINQNALTISTIVATYNGTAYSVALATSGGSGGGAVSYVAANGTASGCTISGSTLTATSSGTCSVTATKASDVGYNLISSTPTTFTFSKATQSALTLTSIAGTYNGVAFSLALTTSGGSGSGAVTYVVANGTATGCTLSGSTLSAATTGTCLVTATKAADVGYLINSSSQTAVAFTQAPQATLTVTSTSATFNGSAYTLALTSSGGSGTGTTTYAVINGSAAGCSVTGSTLTATSAGTCLVTASNPGDTHYLSTASVQSAVTFNKATQAAMTVTSTSANYNGSTFSSGLTSAGGTGTGSLTYAAVNGTATGCTVTGSTLTATSAGTCLVTATNGGDANYSSISSAQSTFTFAKIAQAALVVTSTSSNYNGATHSLALTTSGGSGSGAVSYVAVNGTATGCTIAGSTLTATSAGTCLVTATKAADVGYLAVISVATTVTFKAQPAGQSIDSAPVATLGTIGAGDAIAYTYNDSMLASSLMSGFTGSSTPVFVQFSRTPGASTVLTVCVNSGCTTQVGLGTVSLGDQPGARFITSSGTTCTFNATMAMTTVGGISVVTVTLGTNFANPANLASQSSLLTMVWTPSALATNTNGFASSTTSITESVPKENF